MSTEQILRWLRRGLRLGAVLCLCFILLIIGVGLYTRTKQFHLWLQEQLLTLLQSSINGEVSLERVSGSMWEEIHLQGLSIHQNGVEVAALPLVTVTVNPLAQLLSLLEASTFQITSMTLTDPVLRIVQVPETGWNIAHLIKSTEPSAVPPKESLMPEIFFSRFRLENGQILVRPASGKEFQLRTVTAEGNATLLSSAIRAELSRLDFALTGPGFPPVQWNSRVTYEDGDGAHRLSIHSADLQTPLSRVQIIGTVDDPATPTLALTAEIKKLAADEMNDFLPSPWLRQDVFGTGQIKGPLSALQLIFSLTAPDGQVATTMTADVLQMPFSPQGTLTVQSLTLEKVLRIADVTGEVSGKIAFQGVIPGALSAHLNTHTSNLVAYTRQIGELTLTGDIVRNQGKFTMETRGKLGSISSQWQLSFSPVLTYETTLTVQHLDLSQVADNKVAPVTDLNANAWIKGSGTELHKFAGAAKLTLLSSRVAALNITKGDLSGTVRDGQLTLDQAVLSTNDATVTAHGQVGGLLKTRESTLVYSVQAKNIAPWLALAGITGEGGVDLRGSAGGTLAALRLEGNARVSHLGIGSLTLDDGDLTYLLTDVGDPQLRGRLSTALHDVHTGVKFHTVNADLALTSLRPLGIQANVTAQDEELRTHHVQLQASYEPGHLDALIQDFAIQLPTGVWRAKQPTHLALRNGTLSIEHFELQHGEQSISIDGTLVQQGLLDLQVQIDRFSLAELRPLLQDSPEVSGRVNGRIRVQGTAVSPNLTMNITTSELTVSGHSYAGLTAQGIYQQEHFTFNTLLRQDETHTLSIEGGLPVALGTSGIFSSPVLGEADFRVHSAGLSLAFLSLLSKQIQEVQGQVDMDVRLQGPIHALVLSGPLRVQQGQVRIKPLGQAFTDIAIEVQFAADAARLTQFTIRGGKGTVTGAGVLGLQQYAVKDMALTFDADQFRVINTRQYRAAVSGQLVCSGSPQQPTVKGRLTLVDTAFSPALSPMKSGPAAPDPTITVIQDTEELRGSMPYAKPMAEEDTERSASIKETDLYRQLNLDLLLVIPRDTWVQLEEGSIELMGELRARKERATEISLRGTIETVRGWYAVRGRKFRLERGQIIFTGATPIDPTLDVVARYSLPQYQVDLLIGGTAKTPTVNFHSEPQLEQTDILSLLVFGRPAHTLSENQKTTLQSQAVQIVAGTVAGDLRRELAERLGVDDLEFDVGESLGQSKVGVGKYVVPGVFVSTSQQLGDKQERGVAVDYQLDANWQLKASTTSQGNSGVDILWQKQY